MAATSDRSKQALAGRPDPTPRWRPPLEAGAAPRAASPAGGANVEAIVTYFDQALIDYQLVWLNDENLALHFGYHDAQHVGHHAALENTNQVLADIAGVRPGQRVLDAGCGLGGSACWLARRRGAEVVGITLLPSQVARARQVARRRGLEDRVRFECADFARTPFPAASFDVAWALESVCHAPDKAAFYREMARVLRPGGRLVMGEYIRVSRERGPREQRLLRQWFEGWAIADLDTRDEHVAAATAAGLEDVIVRDVTAQVRPSLARLRRRACAAWPIDLVLHRLHLRNLTQHRNVVASMRQYQALRRNLWFYGILSATRPAAAGADPETSRAGPLRAQRERSSSVMSRNQAQTLSK